MIASQLMTMDLPKGSEKVPASFNKDTDISLVTINHTTWCGWSHNVGLHVHANTKLSTNVIHGNDNPIKIQWVIDSQFWNVLECCKECIQVFLTPISDDVVNVDHNHCILAQSRFVEHAWTIRCWLPQIFVIQVSRMLNPWQTLNKTLRQNLLCARNEQSNVFRTGR